MLCVIEIEFQAHGSHCGLIVLFSSSVVTFLSIRGFALISMRHNHQTSPIGFLSLKLTTPACAVLLVLGAHFGLNLSSSARKATATWVSLALQAPHSHAHRVPPPLARSKSGPLFQQTATLCCDSEMVALPDA